MEADVSAPASVAVLQRAELVLEVFHQERPSLQLSGHSNLHHDNDR